MKKEHPFVVKLRCLISKISTKGALYEYCKHLTIRKQYEETLSQFLTIGRIHRKIIYSIQMPQAVILDLDSTLLDAYGKQEGRAFNFHYQSNDYHPLVCYDGVTGDLIKIQLRDGTQYSCTGVVDLLQPILNEYLNDYPKIRILLRGNSGFATPDRYKQ